MLTQRQRRVRLILATILTAMALVFIGIGVTTGPDPIVTPNELLAVLVGAFFGFLASIPTSTLLLLIMTRRGR